MKKHELNKLNISVIDYQIAKNQYITEEFNKIKRRLKRDFSIKCCSMLTQQWTMFFDTVIRQKGFLPEPSDTILEISA